MARSAGLDWTKNEGILQERALRPAVLWRKGSFGTRSDAGSRFVERILSVWATCRQQARSLIDWLADTVTAHGHQRAGPSLLPA